MLIDIDGVQKNLQPPDSSLTLRVRMQIGCVDEKCFSEEFKEWKQYFLLYNAHNPISLSMYCTPCYYKVYNFLIEKYAI